MSFVRIVRVYVARPLCAGGNAEDGREDVFCTLS